MEMKDIRSSKHGELNGGFSSPKHDHARRSFDKYLASVDTDNANEQVLNQVTDLQKLIKEIKVLFLVLLFFCLMFLIFFFF